MAVLAVKVKSRHHCSGVVSYIRSVIGRVEVELLARPKHNHSLVVAGQKVEEHLITQM
jgi:hypothetical protein